MSAFALRATARHFSFRFGKKIGGPDQVRTDDLRNAIAALFQLSYEPTKSQKGCNIKVSPLKARTFWVGRSPPARGEGLRANGKEAPSLYRLALIA